MTDKRFIFVHQGCKVSADIEYFILVRPFRSAQTPQAYNSNKKNMLKKPNKYSSGATGSKKRGLNARPPPPASVSRLESILDGQIKKKKKRKMETEKSVINNDVKRSNSLVERESNKRNGAMGRRLISDENTRNQAIGGSGSGSNRWSHVNSSSRPKPQTKVTNPFLQANQLKQDNKYPKTRDGDTHVTKSLHGLPPIQSKKNRKKSKKRSDRPHVCREGPADSALKANNNCVVETTVTSRQAVPMTEPIGENRTDISRNKSDAPTAVHSHIEMTPSQSTALNQDDASSNYITSKPTLSHETQVLPQKESNQNTTSSSVESKDLQTVSAFRPKLGLRFGKKTTKGNLDPSSISRFRSSRRVTSSPSEFQRTLPVAHTGLGSQEDDNLVVLRSPEKSDSSSPLHSSNEKDDSAPDENANRGVSTAFNDTAKRSISNTRYKNTRKKNNINDNFVRLNMKNKAGACRGAKNKSSKYSKERRTWTFRGEASNNDGDSSFNHTPMGSFANPALTLDPPLPSALSSLSNQSNMKNNEESTGEGRGGRFSRFKESNNTKSNATSYVSKMSGLDPLDEFVDGTFHASMTKQQALKAPTATAASKATIYGGTMAAEAPKCARHQRPCKLIKVKKATTGNKGREFYACSMPRGEQCDHFQWADDTVEAARCTIAKNSSYSSFITRQVAAYVDRFRTLTVPELKEETAKRGLNKNGKKQQLLMRLAIWTRDELVKCSPQLGSEESEGDDNDAKIDSFICQDIQDENSDDDCSSSSDEDELELFDGAEESDEGPDSDADDDKMDCEVNAQLFVEKERKVECHTTLSTSLREIFGHASFRDGQEWAIQRCLDEKSSLLVAPTGFGKSLCYALPAALMDGVCVVVSPLISLIQDQLRSLPPRIPAATLSGSVSASKTAAIIDDIVRKRLKILFVSPERLTSPAFRRLFNLTWNPKTKTKERKFPEISLLCIDEAHCVSQWAHNFRPCFLRFKGFLKIMKPKSILAITATAGPRVIQDIAQTLGIEISDSAIEEPPNSSLGTQHSSIKIIRSGRDNIDVMGKFLSNQEERLAVVAGILSPGSDKNNPYAGKLAKGSTIVYVWRQRDTEVVAESLKAAGVAGGIVVYHGGMDANARAKSQNKFMRGKARICVATVAFGLGIDKADIVGIVHLYLSNSPEHYLQEIGRAGRDGRSATAIALPLLEEVPTRHSLAYSNLVAKSQISALLRIIRRLVESAGNLCDMRNSHCGRFLHIALPVQSTVRACDCKPETIETFLSLIERIGGDNPLLQIEGYNYDNAAIAMKKRTLKKLAEREPMALSIEAVSNCVDAPLSEAGAGTEKMNAIALPSSFQKQFLAYSKGSHSFSISQCANRLGPKAEPRHVFAALRRLQSFNELEFVLDTSENGRVFQLKISEMGFAHFKGEEFFKTEENLVDTIFESFSSSSDSGATKFLDMHYILDQVADASEARENYDHSEQKSLSTKSSSLVRFQELTAKYFREGLYSDRLAVEGLLPTSFSTIREKELKIDGLSLLRDLPPLFQQNTSNKSEYDLPPEYLKLGDSSRSDYTALAITKFLHGMDTPRTPFLTFRQYPLFGKWKSVDFGLVHDYILKVIESRT